MCDNCGESLAIVCNRCRQRSWSGLADCSKCGHPLGSFGWLAMRTDSGQKDMRVARDQEIARLKVEAAAASKVRMDALVREETHRLAEEQTHMSAIRAHERRLAFFSVAAVVIFVLFIVLVTIMTQAR